MLKGGIAISFALLMAISLASAGEATSQQKVEAELRRNTQELLDAIAPGKVEVWRKYLHPKMLHVDENDTVRGKEELLKELSPLPAGLEGSLEIASFKVELHDNVAVATHEDREHLNYHGQKLASRFRATDTWLKTPEGWRLIATQVLAVLKDPPSITLSEEQFCAYNGTFTLTPDITETIHCKEGSLAAVRSARPEVIYKAEVADVFFVPGRPRTRRIFQRDHAGAIIGFIDRREGEDIVWRKVR
jgi:ketosteroid isomerase-like protein